MFPQLLKTLGYGGHAVVYGGFDERPFALHNFDLLLGGLTVSTYIYRYFLASPATDRAHIAKVLAKAAALSLRVPVAGQFAFTDLARAFADDGAPGRRYFTWTTADEPIL